MPTKQFSLTNNEPPNLSVTWAGGWKNARIALSESPVLEFETQKDLKDGRETILPDFSPPIGAIVVRVFFLIGMSQGFNAISQLKAKTSLT